MDIWRRMLCISFHVVVLVSVAWTQTPAPAEVQTDALGARAREIATWIAAEPVIDAQALGSGFLAAVPTKRLASITRDCHKKGGAVIEVLPLQRDNRWSGRFELVLERKRALIATVTVSSTPPHVIEGLFFSAPATVHSSPQELLEACVQLPGQVSLLAVRLPSMSEPAAAPFTVVAHAPERVLGIGSAFKLWILGALIDDVRTAKRTLADTLALRSAWCSAPSGRLQSWPMGAPVTLHTLATAMISESDNTATDHLLYSLGRGRVEAMLAPMGVAAPERNLPLLATSEMFRIKCSDEPQPPWEALDLAGRRARLEAWSAAPLSWRDYDLARLSKPTRIEGVEWFASAQDLVRTLAWLRQATESGPAAPLREVLAVNPGLPQVAARFTWCGYKGGSEPGVLALAFLLRDEQGGWSCIAAVQNDPLTNLNEAPLMALVESAARLLRPR